MTTKLASYPPMIVSAPLIRLSVLDILWLATCRGSSRSSTS